MRGGQVQAARIAVAHQRDRHAGLFGGAVVGQRITHHQAGLHRQSEVRGDVPQWLATGLALRQRISPQYQRECITDTQVLQQRRHQCFRLVGTDRQWHVARTQLRQRFAHAIEQPRAAQQALTVVHHEHRHHLGQVHLAAGGLHRLLDQTTHTVTDPAQHGGFRHARQADVFQRAVQCFGNIGSAVDQRAIEVEHDQRIRIRQGTAPA